MATDKDMASGLAATGLSPTVEPASGLDGFATSIPDAASIRDEIASSWLRLGRRLAEWGSDYDWIDDAHTADTAIQFLERSERCLLHAACISQGQFLDAQGMLLSEDSRSEAEAEGQQPGPKDAPNTYQASIL